MLAAMATAPPLRLRLLLVFSGSANCGEGVTEVGAQQRHQQRVTREASAVSTLLGKDAEAGASQGAEEDFQESPVHEETFPARRPGPSGTLSLLTQRSPLASLCYGELAKTSSVPAAPTLHAIIE